jgi:O-antigen/teichoic acid export membrane protein
MAKKDFSSVLLLYGLGLAVNRLLSFLLLPLLTNTLLPSEYGLWTLLQSLYLLLLTLSVHSMDEAVLRFSSGAPETRRGFFTAAILGVSVAALLAVLVSIIPLSTMLPAESGRSAYFIFFGLWLFADTLSIVASAYFRAMERPVPVALFLACQNIILVILLYALTIRFPGGVAGVLKAHAITALLSILFWAPFVLRDKISLPSRAQYRALAGFGLPLMFVALMGLLTIYADRYLVNYFLGKELTGIYSVGYKLGMVTFTLLSAFRMGWYPKFYSLHETHGREAALAYARTVMPVLLLLIGSAAFFISAFAPQIAAIPVPGGTFIGREYWSGLPLVGFISLAYLFDGGATLLDAFLYFDRRVKLIFLAAGSALAVNILLNLLLIRPMGLAGAALSTLLSYIALFLSVQIINRKALRLQVITSKSLFLIMYFMAITFAGQMLQQPSLKAALSLAHCGIALYIFLNRKHGTPEQTAA